MYVIRNIDKQRKLFYWVTLPEKAQPCLNWLKISPDRLDSYVKNALAYEELVPTKMEINWRRWSQSGRALIL